MLHGPHQATLHKHIAVQEGGVPKGGIGELAGGRLGDKWAVQNSRGDKGWLGDKGGWVESAQDSLQTQG